MKQLNFLVLLLVFLTLIPTTGYSIGLDYYGIEDTINEDMTVTNEITLNFDTPINHLDYQLGFKISNLEYSSNFDFIDCETIEGDDKSVISCNMIGMTKENNMIELKFIANEGIKQVGENYQFNVNYGISLPIKRSFMVIKLPENSVLAREVANESYFPKEGNIMTDGKHIMVFWEKTNLTSTDSMQFSVLYKTPLMISDYLIIVLTIIIIIVMIGIAAYFRRGREPHSEIVKSVLNMDEKTIIDVLNRHDGEVFQKILVRETDFSKAKISRLVNSLKDRRIIDVEPVSGRENKIVLKKRD